MAIFKCKMCGGELNISEGMTVAECEYCGTQQTLPKLNDDKRTNLYDRANHFRRNNDFDKAEAIYEKILNEDNTDAETYWSLVLCRYGIEYVEDPATHKRVPTVNRTQYTSVFDDGNYKSALQYADIYQRGIYEEEAKAINEIQRGILAISQQEEPFDVFICYKETDNNGHRTPDSVLANDLYHQLTQEGFKVFFSRITLEEKLGSAYEPYIFAALHSAKVMVVLGTKPEYFNAVWVKNEWSRYLSLIKQRQNKILIPAYKDMDPYDLPEEFSHLQAQDMSKLGFMQDLIRGIKKIIQMDTSKETIVKETVVKETTVTGSANTTPLLKRAFMFLEDGDWKSADEYCERVLDIDPENASAYLGKLMAELQVKEKEHLKNIRKPFDERVNYKKVVRFADDELKNFLENITHTIEEKRAESKALIEKNRAHWGPWNISAGWQQTVGLKADGTVVAVGNNDYCLVRGWSDIMAVYAFDLCTVGLKTDGTVVFSADFLGGFSRELYTWTNIVAISTGYDHAVGLKSDGTVVTAGHNYKGQCNISDWENIVAISAGADHTVGLKADGTVIAVGYNKYGQCNVSKWTDIVAISAGADHTVGLKADGTVVAAGHNKNGQCDVSKWADIVMISAGGDDTEEWAEVEGSHTAGLKADGTVVAVGENRDGRCNVSKWKDIVAISAGHGHTIGLKADGTMVAVGNNKYGQCDVSKWSGIIVPDSDVTRMREAQEKTRIEQRRIRAERAKERKKLQVEQEKERARRLVELEKEKANLQSELANLKGLFSGKRRKELMVHLAEIERELENL